MLVPGSSSKIVTSARRAPGKEMGSHTCTCPWASMTASTVRSIVYLWAGDLLFLASGPRRGELAVPSYRHRLLNLGDNRIRGFYTLGLRGFLVVFSSAPLAPNARGERRATAHMTSA